MPRRYLSLRVDAWGESSTSPEGETLMIVPILLICLFVRLEVEQVRSITCMSFYIKECLSDESAAMTAYSLRHPYREPQEIHHSAQHR